MALPGSVTTASVRLNLPSQTMSSTTGACQTCGDGGVTLPSLAKVTFISKQYQVLGWSGVGFHARDWDGECVGALPNAS